ncbi:MAG: GTPase [Deltaproteobacteria bacterium]|nr:GTPase [Deltaproteobacteria bacterium]
MSIINPLSKEISAKIVFYGPGLSGKTTTLKYIYSSVRPDRRGDLVSLATETDRTIFFDFLPLHVEQVHGMGVRIQLYTVPGQVFYAATRKLVLNGADGVVFVADSQTACRDANLESLDDLQDNLASIGLEIESFPLVFQYNKQDLDNILSVEEMSSLLNRVGAPEFRSSAIKGIGVLPTLKTITRLVIHSLLKRHPIVEYEMVTQKKVVEDDSIVTRLSSVAESVGRERPSSTPPRASGDSENDLATDGSARDRLIADSTRSPIPEPIIVERRATVPPQGRSRNKDGISFAPLWSNESDAGAIVAIETNLRNGAYGDAIRGATKSLADLLESLSGPQTGEGVLAKATLLGIDGREYFRLCRMATLPDAALTEEDALFSLYMLISARIKAKSI